MNKIAKGAMAGFGATLPMTLAMSTFHKKLPVQDRHSLPPRKIVMWLSRKIGIKNLLNERQKTALTMIGHFGYGALTGSLIPFVNNRMPLLLRGAILGLGVWAASYLGFLPIANLNFSAVQMTLRRNILMIGSHLVWGLALSLLYRMLDGKILLSGFSRPVLIRKAP